VAWLDGGEMPAVESDHDPSAYPLGQCDHAGVGTSKREVSVDLDELTDPIEVIGRRTF